MIMGGTPSRSMVRKRVSLGQYVGNIGLLSLIPMSRLRPDGRYGLYQRPKSASRRSPGRLPLPATGDRRPATGDASLTACARSFGQRRWWMPLFCSAALDSTSVSPWQKSINRTYLDPMIDSYNEPYQETSRVFSERT